MHYGKENEASGKEDELSGQEGIVTITLYEEKGFIISITRRTTAEKIDV